MLKCCSGFFLICCGHSFIAVDTHHLRLFQSSIFYFFFLFIFFEHTLCKWYYYFHFIRNTEKKKGRNYAQRTSTHETWKLNYLVKCDMKPKQNLKWMNERKEKKLNRQLRKKQTENDNRMIGANIIIHIHTSYMPHSI